MQATERKPGRGRQRNKPEVDRLELEHLHNKGLRLAGWEDVKTSALAERIGMCSQHVRQALTGRRGCTLNFIGLVANELRLTTQEVVARIERAKRVDQEQRRKRDEEYRKFYGRGSRE